MQLGVGLDSLSLDSDQDEATFSKSNGKTEASVEGDSVWAIMLGETAKAPIAKLLPILEAFGDPVPTVPAVQY